jgi:hypothetical protein
MLLLLWHACLRQRDASGADIFVSSCVFPSSLPSAALGIRRSQSRNVPGGACARRRRRARRHRGVAVRACAALGRRSRVRTSACPLDHYFCVSAGLTCVRFLQEHEMLVSDTILVVASLRSHPMAKPVLPPSHITNARHQRPHLRALAQLSRAPRVCPSRAAAIGGLLPRRVCTYRYGLYCPQDRAGTDVQTHRNATNAPLTGNRSTSRRLLHDWAPPTPHLPRQLYQQAVS